MTFIRGAISVDSDTKTEVYKQANKLFAEIQNNNNLSSIVAVFASQTDDLQSFNSCTAIRECFNLNCTMECFQEAKIKDAPGRIIRFTVICNDTFNPKNIYLEKASDLKNTYSRI